MPVQKNIINKLETNFKNNTLAPAVDLIIQERQNAISSSAKNILMKKINNKINKNLNNAINKECTEKHPTIGKSACIQYKKFSEKPGKKKSTMNLYQNKLTEELYNKSLNNKHEITFRSGKKMTLYPYYYSTDFDSRSKQFIETKYGPKGASSFIYLQYYNTKNKTIKSNVIFKLTDWLNNELFGLYFNFLIYKYYESKHPDKLKYLCKLN